MCHWRLVKVQVIDPETEQQTLQAVETALVHYLWPLFQAVPWAMAGAWVSMLRKRVATQGKNGRTSGKRSLFSIGQDGRWRRHKESELLRLSKYQLPDLQGVSASTGSGLPDFPGGIGDVGGPGRWWHWSTCTGDSRCVLIRRRTQEACRSHGYKRTALFFTARSGGI